MENLIIVPESRLKEIIQEVLQEHDSKTKAPQKERLLTINQARISLGLAFSTVKKLINQGVISTTADGNRIPESAINKYLNLKKNA